MTQDRGEILHLLKYGRMEEIRDLVRQQQKENYPNEFVPFMEQMLKEHKISRKNVAVRSGLSQDYVYKLLRGDKHTDERDYILAMCFAIRMNLAQTQKALSSYGMPILSEGDLRSHIIMLALQEGDDLNELDEMLEKAGFPLIKTNPDMPSAPITNTVSVFESEASRSVVMPFQGERRTFEEIDSFTDGYHNGGNAPFDYDYQGWIRLRDEEGQVYQVEAVFKSDYSSFIVFTEAQRLEAERLMMLRQQRENEFYEAHKTILEQTDGDINPYTHPELYEEYLAFGNDIPEAEMLESYTCLEDAAGSEFFPYFLEIDKRTDKKVLEVMKKLDDTREYGIRVGSAWHGKEGPKIYIEMFNKNQPELREYFQLVEYSDGACRYTATHESCFMQLEMGQELYEIYFGPKRAPEYYIDTDKNEFTGNKVRYRFIFNTMRMILHEQIMKTGGFFEIDPKGVLEEKVELLIEQGMQCHFSQEEKQSIAFFKEAIQVLESLGAPEQGHLDAYLCTCFKIARALECLNDSESRIWWDKIYSQKAAVLADTTSTGTAVSCVADAAMTYYREASRKNVKKARAFIREALDLIENHHAAENDWIMQFEVHGGYAYLIEDEDLDESLREYRKALTIARNHHLDQVKSCALSVVVICNNYAWVLWNKCGSEEAVLHYGRAIDLVESYLFSGIIDHNVAIKELEHVGSALNQIYVDTSRTRESERLKERLMENGVHLD